MDSRNHKKRVPHLKWIVPAAVAVIAGCQFITPRNGWNARKWGPLVPHSRFPGDCSLCHLPERWDKLRDDFRFDHEAETGFALEGAHSQAACLRCHNDRGPVTTYVSRGCAGCHQDPHAFSLGIDCESCHAQTTWEPVGLVGEHAATRFPLTGAHAIATCESCHEGAAAGQFRGAPIQCEICHQSDLAQANDPNHISNGWISDCQQCHQPSTWQAASVNHAFFPLSGGHALDCSQCHQSGNFSGLSPDCFSCHQSEYQSTSDPDHAAAGFSTSCEQCHSIMGWIPASFGHTSFPLTGGHAGLDCMQCHSSGVYAGLSTDCYSCHQADYQSAPDHSSLNFPLDCTQCHTLTGWIPANFAHVFPLTGNHNTTCTTCHDSGSTQVFTCFNCHEHRRSEADDEHSEVSGYSYDSQACYNCHPNGTH